ncbi:MAG: leucine-rich repeat domain-containing protein [Tannerella sp.]|jgi:hypothetical protein|nr:leucine-rich repeat domain-containing protein [Tannerella sp.]
MKTKTVLSAMLLAWCVVAAQAGAYWSHPEFRFSEDAGGGAAVIGYTGDGGDVIIPDTATLTVTGGNGEITDVIHYAVTAIRGAFYRCESLTSVTIPGSVTTIGSNSFGYCLNLTSVNIPNLVTTIEVWAFKNCSSLTSVTIPNSVTTIENNAFEGCSGLTSLTIPKSVTTIGDYAFNHCSGLTEVTVEWETPLPFGNYFYPFSGVKLSFCFLFVPVGTKALYRAANVWKDFGTIVEQSSGQANIRVEPTEIAYAGGTLSVNTPRAEVVEIYSVTGLLLLRVRKDAGQASFDLRTLPGGILIARGGSGWVRKIAARR